MKLQKYADIIDTVIQDTFKKLRTAGIMLEGPHIVEHLGAVQYKVLNDNSVVLIQFGKEPEKHIVNKEIKRFLKEAINIVQSK